MLWAAGVQWLAQKYKLYMMLRERLLMDTPQLRTSVTKARVGPETLNDPSFQRRGEPALMGTVAKRSLLAV